MEVIILGAGIAGLGASYCLRERLGSVLVLEQSDTYGGLCGGFEICGYTFDRFVHLTFSTDLEVNGIFKLSSSEIITHIPNPYNIYKGQWIKHPAQNNLFPLTEEEKLRVIADFKSRPTSVDIESIKDYEQWLRIQYGDYFAEHFPMVYTRKYWMAEARDLEPKWIGNRLYQPSIDEVIDGCKTEDTPVTYYAKEMRYPAKGGYKSFLKELIKDADVRYNERVTKIDTSSKTVETEIGNIYNYNRLISSLPLPEVLNMLDSVPTEVAVAGNKLRCTCGYQISIGLKTKNIPPYLWWYIYDEDILPARVYSPSLKSPDNAPEGCSSLQMEIYCEKDAYSKDELISRSVGKLIELNIIKEADILFTDVRFEKYANVIFDHNIYESRKIVRDYLDSVGIETIGRFGEWDYLWSDQSLLSGLNINK